MTKKLKHDFEALHFPTAQPIDWPFRTWVSPEIWEADHSELAWIGFRYADLNFAVHTQNKDLPFSAVICGFVEDAISPARIVLRGTTLFIAIDCQTQMKCVVAAASHSSSLTASIAAWKNGTDLSLTYNRAIIATSSQQELADILRTAGLLMNFLIEHELSHARGGHHQLKRESVLTPQITRSLELVADYNAIFYTRMALLAPFLGGTSNMDDVTRLAKRFGYALTVFLLARSSPATVAGSQYPSFFERLSLAAGTNLVECFKSENWAGSATTALKLHLLGGIKAALVDLSTAGELEFSETYAVLNVQVTPQRANCVTCSVFAREVAKLSRPLVAEIANMSDTLEKFAPTKMGFSRINYAKGLAIPIEIPVCAFDNPMRFRIKKLLRWLSRGRASGRARRARSSNA
ncbi:hypothetical protein ACC716_36255 [Rhizobium johnstonii]|uniref:hypothetical protein n=1 Tax=Rhizobium TaxID=379 RepID=UPI0010321208|nr:hypothetical protein [Rhizobium leguminosarum]TBH47564.1 hypothetical protein ELG62_34710 [Rhizobium leguminosarum]